MKKPLEIFLGSITCFVATASAYALIAGTGDEFVSFEEVQTESGLKSNELRKIADSIQFRFVRDESWFWECAPSDGGEAEEFLSISSETHLFTTQVLRKRKAGPILGFSLSPGEVLIGDPDITPGTCPEGMELVCDPISFISGGLAFSTDGEQWISLGGFPAN